MKLVNHVFQKACFAHGYAVAYVVFDDELGSFGTVAR
jgi:hypothetical protein